MLRAQDKNQALPLDAHQTVLFNEMERIDQSQAMEWNRLVGLHMGPLRQLLGSPEHTDLQREAAALRTGLHTASQLSAGATAHLERVLAFLNRRPLPSV